MNDKKKCCICKKEYSGYGNNPAPVKDRGLCCDACNYGVVIPIRAAGKCCDCDVFFALRQYHAVRVAEAATSEKPNGKAAGGA